MCPGHLRKGPRRCSETWEGSLRNPHSAGASGACGHVEVVPSPAETENELPRARDSRQKNERCALAAVGAGLGVAPRMGLPSASEGGSHVFL